MMPGLLLVRPAALKLVNCFELPVRPHTANTIGLGRDLKLVAATGLSAQAPPVTRQESGLPSNLQPS